MHEPSQRSIDDYVSETRRHLYGAWWTRRRIAAEFDTHLHDSVEALIRNGSTESEAREIAIERFGSPDEVARALAHARGVGIATDLTRHGGVALVVGALAAAAVDIAQEFSEAFRHGAHGDIALPARLLFVVGVLAIYRRVRGNLGIWGRYGFQLVAVGNVVGFASSVAWFEPGGWVALAAIAAGLGAFLTGVLRANVLPSRPVVLLLATAAAAFAIGLAGTASGTDTGRSAQVVGSVGVAVAMTWIGIWLRAERPDGLRRGAATATPLPG